MVYFLKTEDMGGSWAMLNGYTEEDLRSVWFLNDSVGFVCGDNGTFLVTGNGGYFWQQIDLPGTNDYYDIFFLDEFYSHIY